MTTVRGGIPSRPTPLTPEQRLAKAQRVADMGVAAASAAQTDAAAAAVLAGEASDDAADALLATDGLADGTTPFTGLNVGGTNVKPFLDNTDGTKIDTAAGLGAGVVETAAVVAGDITPIYSALTTGTVLWSASSAEKDLQSVAVTVVRGTVKITAQVNVLFDSVASTTVTGILRLYRDATELTLARISLPSIISSGVNFIFPLQWSLSYEEAPGAGSYTYKITFEPGAVNNGQVAQRSLTVLPLEG